MDEKEVKSKIKKESELVSFGKKIFSSDFKTAKETITNNVIIPEIKSFISILGKSVLDNLLYGKVTRPNTNYPYNSIQFNPQTNYNQLSQQTVQQQAQLPKGVKDVQRLTFDDRGVAESVLAQMHDRLNTYGIVSVKDLFELSGQTKVDPASYNYGWKNLNGAEVRRSGLSEFYIYLPPIIPINQ